MRPALLWLVIASSSVACVTYRDRIVVVTQHIEVNQTSTTQPDASAEVNRGAALLPATPGRLDPATMRAALDGFGSWVDAPAYGAVWIPDERVRGADFVPYLSNGQWIPTRVGWYWQSDFAWGAIPFHYGRWVLLGGVWAWVPGSAFAPAWVDWRTGNGWVAWAPLAPLGAAFAASHVYCAWGRLRGAGLRARAVVGPAAVSLYAYTTAVPVSCAHGASCYAPGPPLPEAVATDVSTPWATARANAREGALASGQGTVINPVGTPVDSPARIPDVPTVPRVLNVATGTLRPADAFPIHPAPPPSAAPGGPTTDVEPADATTGSGPRIAITSADAPAARPTSIRAGASGYSIIPARRITWSSSIPVVSPDVASRPVLAQRIEVPQRIESSPAAFVATPPPVGVAPSFAPRVPSAWSAPPSYAAPVYRGGSMPMPSLPTTPSAAVAGTYGRPTSGPSFAPSAPTVFAAPSAPVYAPPSAPAYTAPPITQAPAYTAPPRGSFGARPSMAFAPGAAFGGR